MNRTKINQKANKKLNRLFQGQHLCEINISDKCLGGFMLSFCHRHPRRWYYDKPDELLWDYNQVLLGCAACHEKMDRMSKKDKEEIFMKLRGKENEINRK